MNIKRYFTFKGRINRAKYIWIPFLIGILAVIFQAIFISTESIGLLLVVILLSIASTVLGICLTVQRLHDIERPGTHYWLLLIPIYNIYLGLLLLFKKGTDGPNEYGENPLAVVYE
ncbi:DUF805 domain-containing protein [Maledivibacter halophilus]|uniref:Uncharacterized membrane protein YhaH, DUF805 family n=1 Tax=Maledivibacter halophilus TaxID=36842 RepID=A0A1T5L7N6_9FIRM|nr:DUF805 domain-containing protein [Maledivibacter halophilus]SKC71944.1 Uncharacterized membrane protein YhaH, DUF805 family [Maledivibacter halophilus]